MGFLTCAIIQGCNKEQGCLSFYDSLLLLVQGPTISQHFLLMMPLSAHDDQATFRAATTCSHHGVLWGLYGDVQRAMMILFFVAD